MHDSSTYRVHQNVSLRLLRTCLGAESDIINAVCFFFLRHACAVIFAFVWNSMQAHRWLKKHECIASQHATRMNNFSEFASFPLARVGESLKFFWAAFLRLISRNWRAGSGRIDDSVGFSWRGEESQRKSSLSRVIEFGDFPPMFFHHNRPWRCFFVSLNDVLIESFFSRFVESRNQFIQRSSCSQMLSHFAWGYLQFREGIITEKRERGREKERDVYEGVRLWHYTRLTNARGNSVLSHFFRNYFWDVRRIQITSIIWLRSCHRGMSSLWLRLVGSDKPGEWIW